MLGPASAVEGRSGAWCGRSTVRRAGDRWGRRGGKGGGRVKDEAAGAVERLWAAVPKGYGPRDVVTVKACDLAAVIGEYPCKGCVMVERLSVVARELDGLREQVNEGRYRAAVTR